MYSPVSTLLEILGGGGQRNQEVAHQFSTLLEILVVQTGCLGFGVHDYNVSTLLEILEVVDLKNLIGTMSYFRVSTLLEILERNQRSRGGGGSDRDSFNPS